jgi:hypothetical protein
MSPRESVQPDWSPDGQLELTDWTEDSRQYWDGTKWVSAPTSGTPLEGYGGRVVMVAAVILGLLAIVSVGVFFNRSQPSTVWDAHALAQQLAGQGLPVVDIVTIRSAGDESLSDESNVVLSQAAFTDSTLGVSPGGAHINLGEAQVGPDGGGFIDCLASGGDASRRANTVGGQASIIGTEWVFLSGNCVLRLDKQIPSEEASAYAEALGRITGIPSTRCQIETGLPCVDMPR